MMDKSEFAEKCEKLVGRYVKHYRSDYTDWDVQMFKAVEREKKKAKLLWILRDSGTHLFHLVGSADDAVNSVGLEAVREQWPEHKEYMICYDGRGGWEIKLSAYLITPRI